jgi:hypothetical protein
LAHLDLESQSTAIAERLGLDFAVVWWAIPVTQATGVPVRVTAVPSLADIGDHWIAVGAALLALLSE